MNPNLAGFTFFPSRSLSPPPLHMALAPVADPALTILALMLTLDLRCSKTFCIFCNLNLKQIFLQKKILAPEQLFFISSTMSNKIFIGDPEEDTVTEPTVVVDDAKNDENEDEEEDKSSSRFSSFPIRGLNTLAGPKGRPLQLSLYNILTPTLFQDQATDCCPSDRVSLHSFTLVETTRRRRRRKKRQRLLLWILRKRRRKVL